ncbi:MAG: heavy metal translocating P-type ATPase [Christensenellaceae bacterium]|nr:heavy metal translocating P-type ATPase [Christensenellaceae bacterium]MEA5067635.1 heavy metal translocating P-type ATPase [Christensenellaceae bacterium]
MTKKHKRMLARILLSAALLLLARILRPEGFWEPAAYLIPYAVIGWDIVWRALRGIARGQVFDENFLMSLATVGALATGEYPEAVFVMLFYQVGELFQSYAVGKSRRSIAQLMDIRPDSAGLERDGAVVTVDPDEVQVGDVILVKPGEKIALDGVILEGVSSIDTKALTGESLPRGAEEGDDVLSGCINLSGPLRIKVTKPFGESTVSKILDLVENAGSKKARAEHFITRFARYYTPGVVIAAALLSLVPPLAMGGVWREWIHRAMVFLVISCPCALVISVPLSFFGGIGGASRRGVLIKGGNYLDALARAEIVVFDKTGTLTQGVFKVAVAHPEKDHLNEKRLVELAALAECYSDHPIARSIKQYHAQPLDPGRVKDVEELAGRGVRAVVDGITLSVGNDKLMDDAGAEWRPCHHAGTTVHVALGSVYAGHIVISDEVKEDSAEAIRLIKAQGVRKAVMLTGDTPDVAKEVAKKLGLDEYHAALLPADKVTRVERLLKEKSPKGQLLFVGDGINDAPVLARADVGIAMGAMGADAAIEAADVVLMDDKPTKIAAAIGVSRKTRSIVTQNIAFALGVKALVLALGALGLASMWQAVFADVGVSVIAILNSMRAMRGD